MTYYLYLIIISQYNTVRLFITCYMWTIYVYIDVAFFYVFCK